MNELTLILIFLFAIVLHRLFRYICSQNAQKVWSIYVYISLSIILSGFFYLMLKEGWLERIGLEKTTGIVIILAFIVFYWPIVIARDISKIYDPSD